MEISVNVSIISVFSVFSGFQSRFCPISLRQLYPYRSFKHSKWWRHKL